MSDVLPTPVTPETVKSEIRRTKAFVDTLAADVGDGVATRGPKMTDSDVKWAKAFAEWRSRFDAWAQTNLDDSIWALPGQVFASTTIAAQNDQWRAEAAQWRVESNGMGFPDHGKSPGKAPGGTGPTDFLAGVGTGGLLAIALALYLAFRSNRRDT